MISFWLTLLGGMRQSRFERMSPAQLATVLIGFAAKMERANTKKGTLPITLAEMTDQRSLEIDLGPLCIKGHQTPPWRLHLYPSMQEHIVFEGLSTAFAVRDMAQVSQVKGVWGHFKNALYLGKMAWYARRWTRLGLEAVSLGQALKPLMETVERQQGRLQALFLGAHLAHQILSMIEQNAATATLCVKDASFRQKALGDWTVVLGYAASHEDDLEEPVMQSSIMTPSSSPRQKAQFRRFLEDRKITEVRIAYKTDDLGAQVVEEISLRGPKTSL